MKIIFMGTPDFAVPSLNVLLENNYDIAAVVTVPDKKKGRGQSLSVSSVKNFALEHGLNLLQPESLKEQTFTDEIRTLKPDLIIVVAFRILPREIFCIPGSGAINLHASLLPKYRGAAPINRAIMNGETETGVTTFFLKETVDTGNIILQEKLLIDPEDNAGSVHDKLSELGARAVLETIRLIDSGKAVTSEQDEKLASPAKKIFKEDCKINWNQKSDVIHNFIRGLSPYPGAFTYLENKAIKIFRSGLTNISAASSPGTISIESKRLFISTVDHLLEILEIQSEGKKRINAVDFVNGLDRSRTILFSDANL